MKTIFLALVFLFLFTAQVQAADITISWDANPKATGYMLEYSIDNGLTWTTPQDVGDVTSFLYTVPGNGLVLIRVGAYKTAGITWRLDAGLWYNGDWKPLTAPSSVGIQ